jgi:hypothetical protein
METTRKFGRAADSLAPSRARPREKEGSQRDVTWQSSRLGAQPFRPLTLRPPLSRGLPFSDTNVRVSKNYANVIAYGPDFMQASVFIELPTPIGGSGGRDRCYREMPLEDTR